MDTDQKTLADLSHEVKEKKYVTLDVGSKISGYTQDYLDRLCRLNKIEHRLWNKGGFVVELESLLRETHTLLISDEEINFIDKRELVGVTQNDAPSPPPPVLPTETAKTSPASVKIPVTEIPHQPDSAISSLRTPPPNLPPVTPAVIFTPASPQIAPPSPPPPPISPPPSATPRTPLSSPPPPLPPSPAPILPKQNFGQPAQAGESTATLMPHSSAYDDEWDALLFGNVSGISEEHKEADPSPTLRPAPSEYHPIQTSVDPSIHHDPAPLFSFSLQKITEKNVPSPASPVPSAPTRPTSPTPAPPPTTARPPSPSSPANVRPDLDGEAQMLFRKNLGLPMTPVPVSKQASTAPPATPPRVAPQVRPPMNASAPAKVLAPANVTIPAIPPATLPSVRGEQHLAPAPPHSLMKGLTLSIVIALFAVSSGALLFSVLFPSVTKTILAGAPSLTLSNVANIGLAFPGADTIFYKSK